MSDKVVITCALTGVLTNPEQHPVPVTVEQMAASAREAYDAGAAVMHIHFRRQEPGQGHLPSWEPAVASAISEAIRAACPDVIINYTTGTIGRDQQGALDCIRAGRPEIAACNAGSLNYLKVRSNGTWAWPPMLFQNPVDKIEELLEVLKETGARPEFECFDMGIVRSVGMFRDVGMIDKANYNLVMGVASGMPADADLLPILIRYMKPDSIWQATLIGRQEIWPVHRRTAELGGQLRTGLEDTFYLPDGERARGNGDLIQAMVRLAEETGRTVATPQEARTMFL
ncbi:3-keto-5-aminohexanoate cleavage protein [Exilibacterium tricleocarpae]|uniref:3-keto-5-aminohexanoate cleavage protein n=1 Tax=Exilibacterium tricleocarpae TaxID=2591008 RepID=A0A545TYX4_9GAMM|nr:3-keto-5-aminohexanoate cleavage protein [Exilibacterium tricleocarpae]TQV82422.1 3-keto-5-aminohexanoate cleavage protein [Exilibacterium tricleocarpae]